jgi:hypothetical protein
VCHTATYAAQQTVSLFYHFVGELLELPRHVEAKRGESDAASEPTDLLRRGTPLLSANRRHPQ